MHSDIFLHATVGDISSAYRKPHTCWQHPAALTGGHDLQQAGATGGYRGRPVAPVSSSAVPGMGITVYGCGPDEAAVFREVGPRFGVVPTITEAAVSEPTSSWRLETGASAADYTLMLMAVRNGFADDLEHVAGDPPFGTPTSSQCCRRLPGHLPPLFVTGRSPARTGRQFTMPDTGLTFCSGTAACSCRPLTRPLSRPATRR